MEEYNFKKDEVRNSLLSNKHNNITTWYYLLLKIKMRRGLPSVSDLISNEFHKYLKDEKNFKLNKITNKSIKNESLGIDIISFTFPNATEQEEKYFAKKDISSLHENQKDNKRIIESNICSKSIEYPYNEGENRRKNSKKHLNYKNNIDIPDKIVSNNTTNIYINNVTYVNSALLAINVEKTNESIPENSFSNLNFIRLNDLRKNNESNSIHNNILIVSGNDLKNRNQSNYGKLKKKNIISTANENKFNLEMISKAHISDSIENSNKRSISIKDSINKTFNHSTDKVYKKKAYFNLNKEYKNNLKLTNKILAIYQQERNSKIKKNSCDIHKPDIDDLSIEKKNNEYKNNMIIRVQRDLSSENQKSNYILEDKIPNDLKMKQDIFENRFKFSKNPWEKSKVNMPFQDEFHNNKNELLHLKKNKPYIKVKNNSNENTESNKKMNESSALSNKKPSLDFFKKIQELKINVLNETKFSQDRMIENSIENIGKNHGNLLSKKKNDSIDIIKTHRNSSNSSKSSCDIYINHLKITKMNYRNMSFNKLKNLSKLNLNKKKITKPKFFNTSMNSYYNQDSKSITSEYDLLSSVISNSSKNNFENSLINSNTSISQILPSMNINDVNSSNHKNEENFLLKKSGYRKFETIKEDEYEENLTSKNINTMKKNEKEFDISKFDINKAQNLHYIEYSSNKQNNKEKNILMDKMDKNQLDSDCNVEIKDCIKNILALSSHKIPKNNLHLTNLAKCMEADYLRNKYRKTLDNLFPENNNVKMDVREDLKKKQKIYVENINDIISKDPIILYNKSNNTESIKFDNKKTFTEKKRKLIFNSSDKDVLYNSFSSEYSKNDKEKNIQVNKSQINKNEENKYKLNLYSNYKYLANGYNIQMKKYTAFINKDNIKNKQERTLNSSILSSENKNGKESINQNISLSIKDKNYLVNNNTKEKLHNKSYIQEIKTRKNLSVDSRFSNYNNDKLNINTHINSYYSKKRVQMSLYANSKTIGIKGSTENSNNSDKKTFKNELTNCIENPNYFVKPMNNNFKYINNNNYKNLTDNNKILLNECNNLTKFRYKDDIKETDSINKININIVRESYENYSKN